MFVFLRSLLYVFIYCYIPYWSLSIPIGNISSIIDYPSDILCDLRTGIKPVCRHRKEFMHEMCVNYFKL